jgi:hypothetical protein
MGGSDFNGSESAGLMEGVIRVESRALAFSNTPILEYPKTGIPLWGQPKAGPSGPDLCTLSVPAFVSRDRHILRWPCAAFDPLWMKKNCP